MPSFDGEQLMDQISRHVFLVLLRVSWPKMSYQIADAIVEVKVKNGGQEEEKKEIDEEFRTKPQWQLMPEEWRKKLVNLEGRARSMLSHASIQFAARGMAVLPVSRAREVFGGLRTLRAELEQLRDEFIEDYAEILQALEGKLDPALFQKVQGKLPAVEDVAGKFEIVWAIVPAGGRGGVNSAQLRALERGIRVALSWYPELIEALDKVVPRVCDGQFRRHQLTAVQRAQQVLRDIREHLGEVPRQISGDEAADVIDEAREQMHQFTQDILEDMAREPREILQAATDNLLTALATPDRAIRNGTINQVREAFEMVQGFEFLAGPQLLQAMRECQNRLDGATPRQLNSDAAIGARLAEGLTAVRDAAADAEEASTMMRQFRHIRIRPREEDDDGEESDSTGTPVRETAEVGV